MAGEEKRHLQDTARSFLPSAFIRFKQIGQALGRRRHFDHHLVANQLNLISRDVLLHDFHQVQELLVFFSQFFGNGRGVVPVTQAGVVASLLVAVLLAVF